MNFILTLSENDGMDILLTITDKFIKQIALISEKSSDTVWDWAQKIVHQLRELDWDISQAIISDRDSKFMSELWKTVFTELEVQLLMSTTYHFQTDRQSEQINQTVKIAFQYFCTENLREFWVKALLSIQTILNNSVNQFTEHASTELMYRFRICKAINLLHKLTESEIDQKIQCKNISDAVTFINVKVKIQYDLRHKSLLLEIENMIYLQINQNYNTLVHWVFNISIKFLEQWVSSIQVTERIERNAYRLNTLSHWRIHSVISVTQLKSADITDLWKHSASTNLSAVSVTEDTDKWRFYKIKKLISYRERTYSDKIIKKYLVRWKEYSVIHNK